MGEAFLTGSSPLTFFFPCPLQGPPARASPFWTLHPALGSSWVWLWLLPPSNLPLHPQGQETELWCDQAMHGSLPESLPCCRHAKHP